ncbi:peptidase S8/S53 domain-containing protein, partial [Blastocladiella britannica]
MLRTLLASALVAVLATSSVQAAPKRHHRQRESALISSETATKIPGHYMVMLREDAEDFHVQDHFNWLSTFLATSPAAPSTNTNKNRVKHVYDMPGLKGYAGHFDEAALRAIRAADHVAYIEQDQVVKIVDENEPPHAVIQKDAPWGLSRISHRDRPSAAHYKEYPHSATAGANVSVYVIDTGINIKHLDFEGRARWGATIPENDEDEDGNGHGTHCAGTISGKRYGVAKKANAVAVKVLSSNGSGSMSDVVKGVEWAVQDHKRRRAKNPKAKSAANMSLGGGSSKTLDRIVNAAVDAGIAFAVAAGNDNRNACNYSPAAAEKAVTVGATANDDTMAWFSNHGKCVDVFAPGKDVLSTWIGSNVATNTISGTSMASPHVAGLLAYHLSQTDEEIKPKALKDLVIKAATKDVIKGLPK